MSKSFQTSGQLTLPDYCTDDLSSDCIETLKTLDHDHRDTNKIIN